MDKNQLAIVKKDIVDVVGNKIKEFLNNKELKLPPNYSPDNAMKSAFLILQRTVDRNKQPVLKVCDKNSVANALLDMVVQGLNPAKDQGYFIAYGNQLVFQRSYFGTMSVCKTLCKAKDIHAQVVWQGDVFEYSIERGNKVITKHTQKIENVGKQPIAAYCIIMFEDGTEYTDVMTFDQIKKAWSKSKMNPDKEGSTHRDFVEEMSRRTIINRACKKYINSSSDAGVLIDRFYRSEDVVAEIEFENEVNENANNEIIDIENDETIESIELKPEELPEYNPDIAALTEEEKQEIMAQEIADNKGPSF